MNGQPVIKVQLVHIQGPLKGQIQEFTETSITMGRHPSCTVQFPADTATISRNHAEIVRVDNRFKIVDKSTNGTYLNGKKVTEAFLKDGDVIMLTEGGPKMSFLAQITSEVMPRPVSAPPVPESRPAPPVQERPAAPAQQKPAPAAPPVMSPPPQSPPQYTQPARPADVPQKPAQPVQPQRQNVQKVQAPLIIQFGPVLKSYKELPIVIGKRTDCDFPISHPAIADQHVQIFFSQGQYWVRDLTGSNCVSVNGAPIGFEAPLKAQDILSLAAGGPAFNYISDGRLAEHEVEEQEAPAPSNGPEGEKKAGEEKKGKSFLRDFFKK